MCHCSLLSIKNASRVSEAMDKINDRWGEFVIMPALMMGMDDIILDRIAFGGVKELEEIYAK
jgi:DNA polymerase IV